MDDSGNKAYQVPSVVMSSAATKLNVNASIGFLWTPDNGNTVTQYIYLHFSELEKLQPNQTREFNVFLNGDLWLTQPVVPYYLSTTTAYSTTGTTRAAFKLWLNKTETSTLPPILNAIEIYTLKQLLQAQTDQEGVDAIKNIESMYRIKRNWQGDPCAPKDYSWDGLSCSYYNAFDSPSFISFGLTGNIAPFISNLTMIQYLNLQNNNLSGSIPMELIERSNKGSLLLSIGGNPNPCVLSPCKKKKNIVVPAAAAAVGFFILLLWGLALFWQLKRTKKGEVNIVSNEQGRVLESKKQQFTYSEGLSITNNFASVIAKGGFGTVYHGYLDGFQVAVKMLSPSSVLGCKEFQVKTHFMCNFSDNIFLMSQ
ncbi:hypothetical protein RGQ29_021198 [Quercus rubra]|uniref:Malectin-like domain-containing protein n=1 Tax=Quercus rubra TaxID=3512 RepID=A0AAN7IYI3_QUERU|nr:hypothetical protein RGQ29_021198 [Quercus rubra]